MLKKDNLSFTEKKLEDLHEFIEKFHLEFKFNRNSHRMKYSSINRF